MSDEFAEKFLESLERFKTIIPIDKNLFIMYYQMFQDIENSPIVRDYLVNHKEIDIDVMKNTKTIFHEIIWRYIMRISDKQNPDLIKDMNEIDSQVLLDEIAINLVTLSEEQNIVMRLPTIEQLRKQKDEAEKEVS